MPRQGLETMMENLVREYLREIELEPESLEGRDHQNYTIFTLETNGGTILSPIESVTTTWLVDSATRRFSLFTVFHPVILGVSFEVVNEFNSGLFNGAWMAIIDEDTGAHYIALRHSLQVQEQTDMSVNLVRALSSVHLLTVKEEGPRLIRALQKLAPQELVLH
jgi:hypothetical protein